MNTYKTTNLYLAAALVSLGASVDDVDHSDRKHQVFILSGKHDFQTIERAWYDGCVTGNLCHYRDAIQKLKSKIHSF